MDREFQRLVEIERESYVAYFRQNVAAMRSSPNFVTELLMQPNGRTTPEPFCLMRIDGIFGGASDPKIVRFVLPNTQRPINRNWLLDGFDMRIEALSWESFLIRFKVGQFKLESLAPWLTLWLDPKEHRAPDKDGLSGVVHDMAWTYGNDNTIELTIDFGSAPLQALFEFLALIKQSGVTACTISRGDSDIQ